MKQAQRSRLGWSCLALLILSSSFVDLAAAQQKPKLKPLHIALANHSATMTHIYVAKHLGIFENYGYDARVLVLEPRAGLAAMLAGELDFYSAVVPPPARRCAAYRCASA